MEFGEAPQFQEGVNPSADPALRGGPVFGGSRQMREFDSKELARAGSQPVEPVDPQGGADFPRSRGPAPGVSARPVPVSDLMEGGPVAAKLEMLERSVSQTRSILEKLLRELIRKDVFTREEILRLLGGK
jgi:hypothetical protein